MVSIYISMVIAVLDPIGEEVTVQKDPLFGQYSRQYGKKCIKNGQTQTAKGELTTNPLNIFISKTILKCSP